MAPVSLLRNGSLCCALLAGCRYDIDKIYEHASPADQAPRQLVELWEGKDYSTVDDACVQCAARECADVNERCREDPECLALTQCIAESTDPVTQQKCRARHVEWLSQEIDARDYGGPFQQCLLQDSCYEQCGSRQNWQCVGGFDWPTTGARSVFHTLRFIERDGSPVADMDVKVCRPDDLQCEQPTSSGRTDDDGTVKLELPIALRTFQGYLELVKDDIYPTLLRFGWPIAQDGVTNIIVIDTFSWNANVTLSMANPDPERGFLQLRAFTCAGVGAEGVSFSSTGVDEESVFWYASGDGIPDFDLTATELLGAGGVMNVDEGRQIVTGSIVADGQTKVISRVAAPVRKGHMTIVLMAPLDEVE